MPTPLLLPRAAARAFHRELVGLNHPFPNLSAAVAYHGYIQIDPINVCGRMHDLILRNRVAGYREGDLTSHLHGQDATAPAAERLAFEHHLPDTHVLVAFPLEAWPHLHIAMEERARQTSAWSGRFTPRERELVPKVLAEIEARGPLSSENFDDRRTSARRTWGRSTLVKATLQKLFFHGRLLIARRENNRRLYDLPEKILPPEVLAQPTPTAAETARWLARLKMRQRRLTTLTRAEVACLGDAIQPVAIEPTADAQPVPTLYCLREDAARLPEAAAAPDETAARPRLIAPLDPLIYDRRTTSALWDFDYTWEVYTPAAKRVRGYYALPILAGTELVGHVDAKADRKAKRLRVMSRSVRRGYASAPAVSELAAWLGLKG